MSSQPLVTVTAKVAVRERDELERIARGDDRTLSYVARRAVREYLERQDIERSLREPAIRTEDR